MADLTPRAAIHAKPQTALSHQQIVENTRDAGWDKDGYTRKNLETGHHYDITRKRLNFAVTRDGHISLDRIKASQVYEKYLSRLEQLHFKAYDKDATNQPNSYIDWVFSGDHDVMTKLAFGDQEVALDLSADNSHVYREKGIDDFAQAVYDFSCKMFGEPNVLGVEVHLDETTPHVHVNMVPVALRQQRGRASHYYVDAEGNKITSAEYRKISPSKRKDYTKSDEIERKMKECVSYSGLVGENRAERSAWLKNFHTLFYEEVGKHFGLERGRELDTLPEEERKKVKYMTPKELEADRQKQLQKNKEAEEDAKRLDEELAKRRKAINDAKEEEKEAIEAKKQAIEEKEQAQDDLLQVQGDIYLAEQESSNLKSTIFEQQKEAERLKQIVAERELAAQKAETRERAANEAKKNADAALASTRDAVSVQNKHLKTIKDNIIENQALQLVEQAKVRRAKELASLADEKKKTFDVTFKTDDAFTSFLETINSTLTGTPGMFEDKAKWMETKRNAVIKAYNDLKKKVQNEGTRVNNEVVSLANRYYNNYMSKVQNAIDNDATIRKAIEEDTIAKTLKTIAQSFGDGILVVQGMTPSELAKDLKEEANRQKRVVSSFFADAVNNKYTSKTLEECAEKWDSWKRHYITNSKDPKTVFGALQKFVGLFLDALYGTVKGLQESFDKLCSIIQDNEETSFLWSKKEVLGLANITRYLASPYIETDAKDKAHNLLVTLVNGSSIVKEEEARKAQEAARSAEQSQQREDENIEEEEEQTKSRGWRMH